jgi:hypothetical protein
LLHDEIPKIRAEIGGYSVDSAVGKFLRGVQRILAEHTPFPHAGVNVVWSKSCPEGKADVVLDQAQVDDLLRASASSHVLRAIELTGRHAPQAYYVSPPAGLLSAGF